MIRQRESSDLTGALVSRAHEAAPLALPTRLPRAALAVLEHWRVSGGARRRARAWVLHAVGVALLVIAAIAYVTQNAPLHNAQVQAFPTQDIASADVASAGDAMGEALVAKLPGRNDMPRIIAGLQDSAQTSGIALDKGRYELAADSTPRIARYRVTLPLSGGYPQIRAFIDRALQQYPSVGVDQLQLNRREVGDDVIHAELALSIFVRNAP